MLIGVPLETAAGEPRVAASATDEAYQAVGAEITDRNGAFAADLILKVRSPSPEELKLVKAGAALVGMLNPFDKDNLTRLAGAGLTSCALEAAPRTTRAQSMDVRSSRANITGGKTMTMAADKYQRLFPMLITAAGGGASAPNT